MLRSLMIGTTCPVTRCHTHQRPFARGTSAKTVISPKMYGYSRPNEKPLLRNAGGTVPRFGNSSGRAIGFFVGVVARSFSLDIERSQARRPLRDTGRRETRHAVRHRCLTA